MKVKTAAAADTLKGGQTSQPNIDPVFMNADVLCWGVKITLKPTLPLRK